MPLSDVMTKELKDDIFYSKLLPSLSTTSSTHDLDLLHALSTITLSKEAVADVMASLKRMQLG